jgi:3-methylcrotonyl-CoA carboxylase beta subunit
MATLASSIDKGAEAYKANAAIYDDLIKTLHTRQAWALAGGGDRMMQRHRERGKIPARDRIDMLIDPLSPFLELSPLAAWGLYDPQARSCAGHCLREPPARGLPGRLRRCQSFAGR